jgi:hypothetical protein
MGCGALPAVTDYRVYYPLTPLTTADTASAVSMSAPSPVAFSIHWQSASPAARLLFRVTAGGDGLESALSDTVSAAME